MALLIAESREEVAERLRAGSHYDWAMGEVLTWTPDSEEAAKNEERMAERYRAWARANVITYAPNKYESAFRHYKAMPFETVNPIEDTVVLPKPRYDERLKKMVVPKNVYDKNVLSRRRFLFEIDGMTLEDQKALLEPLLKNQIIQRVVYSGNKSLHCIVEEADEPDASPGEEMYKWAWRFIAWKYFKDQRFGDFSLPMKIDHSFPEVVDNRCGHPTRMTRSPFAVRNDESTGGKPVEQKLLYFESVRADSLWRNLYNQMKAREAAEQERMRRRARQNYTHNREQGKKTPNEAAKRFISGDQSDGWKHASLPSAVGSLKACGYSLEEMLLIFEPYSKELQTFAMFCWDKYAEREEKHGKSN